MKHPGSTTRTGSAWLPTLMGVSLMRVRVLSFVGFVRLQLRTVRNQQGRAWQEAVVKQVVDPEEI